MPEIKNMFQKGVMNKDLDERLVPNGQYRDAMNVQVSTSESSEVGTVQNILGNVRVEDIVGEQFKCVGAVADEKNDVLYWFITSPTVDAIVEYRDDPNNQSTDTCIPILVDTNKDVLKFNPGNLITGINIIDNLLFWTDDVNEPKKINIDTFKLNFTVNNHTDLTIHSQMFVNDEPKGDVTEDHITVIRKRPQKAPTIVFSESTYADQFFIPELNLHNAVVGTTIPGYVWDRTYGLTNNTGQDLLPMFPYNVGEEFVISLDSEPGNLPYNYQVKLVVEAINGPFLNSGTVPPLTGLGGWSNNTIGNYVSWTSSTYDLRVVEISQIYQDQPLAFNATRIPETKPIFQKELIRFATRWKYADGEYSAYSPFTTPVFLAGQFYFHPTEDPFNRGMESKAVSITLQDLIPLDTPSDVVQLDILFKKERSTTIYSIDSIKPSDVAPADHWNLDNFSRPITISHSYPHVGSSDPTYLQTGMYDSSGEYKITTENIYAALPDNQMLRPWDNVPRKALGQEITANRIVYGNYLQNYNLKDYLNLAATPWVIVDKENREILDKPVIFTNNVGKKSIKSLRTYYLGVIYGDKYGRETPVLTSKDASIHVPFDFDDTAMVDLAADKSLRLTAKLIGEQPEWAHYYKYFIKQTTGEYYNLTMDRVYKSDGDDNLWISFPSSDRNKVQEGDYFSIKKQVDIETIVPVENKIKIIDIKNEAPETIKYEYISLGNGGGTQGVLNSLFPDPSAWPAEGTKRLLIDKDTWVSSENGLALENLTKSDKLAVQFNITTGGFTMKSEKYLVSGFALEEGGEEGNYNLLLRKRIAAQDNWVESSPGVLNYDDALTITVYKLEQKPATEFEGRFFVKIVSSPVTQTYLVPSAQDLYNWQVLGTLLMFRLTDKVGSVYGTTSWNAGIKNVSSSWSGTADYPTTGVDLSEYESYWNTNTTFGTSEGSSKGWFLDYTGFVASQHWEGGNGWIGDTDAKHSGKMYKGRFLDYYNTWPYPLQDGKDEYINGMEGIFSPPLGGLGPNNEVLDSSWISSGPYEQSSSGTPIGPRHWSPDSPAYTWKPSYTYNQGSPSPEENTGLIYSGTLVYPLDFTDSPYDPVAGGGHFMHLSFACPGEDLHDGDFNGLENAINNWKDNHQYLDEWGDVYTVDSGMETDVHDALQLIRGSGLFLDGAGQSNGGGGLDDSWGYSSSGTSYTPLSHYDDLSSEQKEIARNQWNPGWNNPSGKSIVDRLIPGSRFTIIGDTNINDVYTIQRVHELRLYNHTSFNPMPRISSNGALRSYGGGGGDRSVAEALQHMFKNVSDGWTQPGINNNGANDYPTDFQNLCDAIYNFGKANNRRTCYVLQLDKDPSQAVIDAFTAPTGTNTNFPDTANKDISQVIRFVDDYLEPGGNTIPTSPAIFETEAKEDQDLNIYYEASDALPVGLDSDPMSLKGHLLGPIGSRVTCTLSNSLIDYSGWNTGQASDPFLRVLGWSGDIVELNSPGLKANPSAQGYATTNDQVGWDAQTLIYSGKYLKFWKEDGSYTTAQISEVVGISTSGPDYYITKVKLNPKNFKHNVGLSYYNCFSFGNGVESNRIRDDFNESYILNGVKASTVLEEPYEEERRKYGLIYSGLYNSTSGVNNLNQFIQAEKITKDLMPSYGSIQKLYARDKDLITLCEDKIIRIYVDKDILYNADGNTQLLATNRVLGTAEPFRGNFGISKNPESFAAESFRAYFTDKQRGAVMRLSMDGLTPISDAGMHDFFRDNLRDGGRLYGSYDAHKGDYNLSISYETGINQVCNPGFEEGLSTDIQLLSSFVLNYSFTNISTSWNNNQIFNGDFSPNPNTMSDGWFNNASSGGVSWSDGSYVNQP